jgi:hypothetical protein
MTDQISERSVELLLFFSPEFKVQVVSAFNNSDLVDVSCPRFGSPAGYVAGVMENTEKP